MTLYQHTQATLKVMAMAPVIPVMTVASVEDGLAQARALVAGGLPVLEITLRTPAAMDAIKAIAAEVSGAVVGAGTITKAAQIEACVKAGATFLVSPGTSPALAQAAAESPIPFLPGIATVSEAMNLMDYGFTALKFFPAEAAGGVKYLSSIGGPLSELRFCPTGGIDAEKAKTYLGLKNVVCVGGSWMIPASALAAKDYALVEKLAHEAAKLKG